MNRMNTSRMAVTMLPGVRMRTTVSILIGRGNPGGRAARFASSPSFRRRIRDTLYHTSTCVKTRVAATDEAASESDAKAGPAVDVPSLDSLTLVPVVSEQGTLPGGVEGAAVFAIYDKDEVIQYVGFSSSVGKSIEKLFYRRPGVTFFFKYAALDSVDQDAMMQIRNGWFDALEGPPIGNKNPVEKEAWQVPVQVAGNSEGGTLVAAQEAAAMMSTQIKNRGCAVDFAPEPALLQKGIIEFVTLTPEEIERIRIEKEKLAESIKQFTYVNDEGEEVEFELLLNSELKTNGGYMYDVTLMHDARETNHRVIVGKKYYKHGTFEPEEALGATFGYILKREIPRQTEGILSQTQFSSNYFSVAEVHQCFADFEDEIRMQIDGDSFWKFRKIEKYGYARQVDDAEKLNLQFKRD